MMGIRDVGTVIGRPSTGEGVPLVGTARPAKNAGLLNNENRNEIKRQIVIIDSLTHPQGVHSEINGRPMTVPTSANPSSCVKPISMIKIYKKKPIRFSGSVSLF